MSKVTQWNYDPEEYKGCNSQIEALKNELRIGDSIKLKPQKLVEGILDTDVEPVWQEVIGIYPNYIMCQHVVKSGDDLTECYLYHEILQQGGKPLHAFSKAV